uniref:HEAT repeat-containing protein 1 n=1 Tax=Echinostoma caproni TaxID=27848 RepID=A0A183BF40_9TREM
LRDLPGLLVTALSQGQNAVVRVRAIQEICSRGTKLRQFRASTVSDNPQTSAEPAVSGSAITLLLSHLPSLVTGVVDCLSQFGEPVLTDGLDALCGLLRIDPQGFTCSARTQVTSILVELFKHCFGVAGTFSLYLDVLRTVCQAAPDQSNEAIEQAFMPTLLACLEQPDTVDTVAIEVDFLSIGMDVSFKHYCLSAFNQFFFQYFFHLCCRLCNLIRWVVSGTVRVSRKMLLMVSHMDKNLTILSGARKYTFNDRPFHLITYLLLVIIIDLFQVRRFVLCNPTDRYPYRCT